MRQQSDPTGESGHDETMNLTHLAYLHGAELDEMLLRQDYICAECGLANANHRPRCGVLALLDARKRMVPMVRRQE